MLHNGINNGTGIESKYASVEFQLVNACSTKRTLFPIIFQQFQVIVNANLVYLVSLCSDN